MCQKPTQRLHRQSDELDQPEDTLAQLSDSDGNLLSALHYRAAIW